MTPPVTHTLNLDDMLAWIAELDADWRVYASDGRKRLEFCHAGGYRVQVGDDPLYQGTDGRSAVTVYNKSR